MVERLCVVHEKGELKRARYIATAVICNICFRRVGAVKAYALIKEAQAKKDEVIHISVAEAVTSA